MNKLRHGSQLLAKYILRWLVVQLVLIVLELAREMVYSVRQIYHMRNANLFQDLLVRCYHLVSDVEAGDDFIYHYLEFEYKINCNF